MTWLSWPNRITIVRTLLIAPLIICLLNMNRPSWTFARQAALLLFVLIGISDAVDGYLARRLGQVTAVGKFLDPLADKILIACTTILLAVESTAVPEAVLPNWVPVIAIGKDMVTVTGFGLVYLTTGRFLVHARPLGKTCTVVQLIMIALVLVAPDLPPAARRLPEVAWWAASVLAVVATIDYLRWGSRAARAAEIDSAMKEQPK
ncbi:MAG: CDP-alcohol phosphatidyltransferase family protein [Phycisphaerales bacterium]|nr:MAG: CDP-alcohol phosphatidyltransferase family protein [Phycisphaerales bacterium]